MAKLVWWRSSVTQVACGQTPSIYGDGKQTRDYIYVLTLGTPSSWRPATQATKQYSTSGQASRHPSPDLLNAINAAAGTAVEPAFALAQPGESRHVALDCARAVAELNWVPALTLEAGVRRPTSSDASTV
jgi:UDP-glucose 4-epimerase